MHTKHKLAVLAGEGRVPAIVVEQAMQRDAECLFVPIVPDFIKPKEVTQISPFIPATKLKQLLKTVADFGATEVILVGKIPKRIIAHSRFRDYDIRTFWLKKRMLKDKGTLIYDIIEEEFTKAGITMASQAKYLEDLLDFSGILTKVKPSRGQWEDIRYGLAYAREIAKLEIGQTIVIKKGVVLAAEAIEGTDATISRAKDFTGGRGAVVCKVEKPLQDLRFDIPAVGLETLKVMKQTGCDVLAVEEKKTILVDYADMISFANENDIAIVSQKVKSLMHLDAEDA